jgi:hypothetical protein
MYRNVVFRRVSVRRDAFETYLRSEKLAVKIAGLMKTIRMTSTEYKDLRELQARERWDWPAWFGVNSSGEMWPGTTFGRTPDSHRVEVSGLSEILDRVKDAYLGIREQGGRLFISERGGFHKADGNEVQFVEFKITD